MKHIEGPWEVFNTDIWGWINPSPHTIGIFIATLNDEIHTVAGIGDRHFCTSEERKANGRLIAAAPDLLEACQLAAKEIFHLMSELGDDPNTVGCYTTLQQAIAKAID